MKIYIIKLKHILPTFFAVTFGTVIGLALIRWIFCIRFSIIDIEEEVWTLWIPLIFPWIPIVIWLRQRFRILTFKKDNSDGRVFFQFISWVINKGLTLPDSLWSAQRYVYSYSLL